MPLPRRLPRPELAPEASFGVEERDLGRLAPEARASAVEEEAREARRTPFDVAHGPLLKVTRFELAANIDGQLGQCSANAKTQVRLKLRARRARVGPGHGRPP